MSLSATREHFETLAAEYDDFIRRLIPYYEDMNQVVRALIPYEKDEVFHAIDLGAGTGALSGLILEHFPHAQVTLLDMTENMLAMCRQKFAAYEGRVHYIQGDFEHAEFGGPFDLAVAGLSIHHVSDEEKRQLFHKVSAHLHEGSPFLIRDYVRGESDALESLYQRRWESHWNFRDAEERAWFDNHMQADIPALLADQLDWLHDAGFRDIDCFFKYFSFVVFGGKKAHTPNG